MTVVHLPFAHRPYQPPVIITKRPTTRWARFWRRFTVGCWVAHGQPLFTRVPTGEYDSEGNPIMAAAFECDRCMLLVREVFRDQPK